MSFDVASQAPFRAPSAQEHTNRNLCLPGQRREVLVRSQLRQRPCRILPSPVEEEQDRRRGHVLAVGAKREHLQRLSCHAAISDLLQHLRGGRLSTLSWRSIAVTRTSTKVAIELSLSAPNRCSATLNLPARSVKRFGALLDTCNTCSAKALTLTCTTRRDWHAAQCIDLQESGLTGVTRIALKYAAIQHKRDRRVCYRSTLAQDRACGLNLNMAAGRGRDISSITLATFLRFISGLRTWNARHRRKVHRSFVCAHACMKTSKGEGPQVPPSHAFTQEAGAGRYMRQALISPSASAVVTGRLYRSFA